MCWLSFSALNSSCAGAGYLLYDTSNMLVYFKYLGDPSAIIHHILFMLAAAYVLDQSIMAFPFIWLALGEISTPSVNLRCCSLVQSLIYLHDRELGRCPHCIANRSQHCVCIS